MMAAVFLMPHFGYARVTRAEVWSDKRQTYGETRGLLPGLPGLRRGGQGLRPGLPDRAHEAGDRGAPGPGAWTRSRRANAWLTASQDSWPTPTVSAERGQKTGLRTITEIDLIEISLVTLPANEAARVTAVKLDGGPEITGIRDFEAFLRDAGGFSRAAAKALAAGGWPALADQREVDDTALADLAAALTRATATFNRERG
jgi:hypothetical protein